MLPSGSFPSDYQYATIPAGETGTVLLIKIPESMIGFITGFANSWFHDTQIKWYVDGELYKIIESDTAHVSNPKGIHPPILVKAEVKVIAVNNDTVSHTFECKCEGSLYPIGESE